MVMGRRWPRCPAAICRTPAVKFVIDVYNAKQVNPLVDWPDGHAAWVQEGVCALEASSNERTRRELEQVGKR